MKVGHVCLYVFFPVTNAVVRHPREYHLALARLWPRRWSDIGWPPAGVPEDGPQFEEFANRFWRDLQVYTREQAIEHDIRDS
jgi:hypothetical protein